MLSVLAVLANFFSRPGFRWWHEMLRRFYTRWAPWLLQKRYGHRWLIRHSAAQPGLYHFLYSDLDFALILQPGVDLKAASHAIHGYLRLRARLPIFGELEVYFHDEWEEKIQLEAYHGPLLRWVRDRRKEVWVENDLVAYKDAYHLNKAKRTLQKLRRTPVEMTHELEIMLSVKQIDWLEEQQIPSLPVIPYYGKIFRDEMPSTAKLFLALVAPHFQVPNFPKNHPLVFERTLLARYEALCYRAYLRSNSKDIFAHNDWLDQLTTQYRLPTSEQNWKKSTPRVRLSEIPFQSQNMWDQPFILVFERPVGLNCIYGNSRPRPTYCL